MATPETSAQPMPGPWLPVPEHAPARHASDPLAAALDDLPALATRLAAADAAQVGRTLTAAEHAAFVLRLCRYHVRAVHEVLLPGLAEAGPLPADLLALRGHHQVLLRLVGDAVAAVAGLRYDPSSSEVGARAADAVRAVHALLAEHLPAERQALGGHALAVLSGPRWAQLQVRAVARIPARDRARARAAVVGPGGSMTRSRPGAGGLSGRRHRLAPPRPVLGARHML